MITVLRELLFGISEGCIPHEHPYFLLIVLRTKPRRTPQEKGILELVQPRRRIITSQENQRHGGHVVGSFGSWRDQYDQGTHKGYKGRV